MRRERGRELASEQDSPTKTMDRNLVTGICGNAVMILRCRGARVQGSDICKRLHLRDGVEVALK